MEASFLPSQTVDARNFYGQIKKDFPNQNIILTGHSLGGSLAQIVGSETGEKTVTFEAYGIKNALDPDSKFSDNITNYGNANDPVFMANVDNQIGKTFVTNGYESNEGYVDKKLGFNDNVSLDYHNLDNIGDLSKAVEYDKYSELGKTVLKGSVEYNDTKQFTREDIANMTSEEFSKNEDEIMRQMANGEIQNEKSNTQDYQKYAEKEGKIFTREEIGKMTSDEYQKNEPAIMKQLDNIGIPSEKDLSNGQSDGQKGTQASSKKETNGGADSNKSNSSGGGSKSGGNSSGDGSSSGDGNWVTINGHHVLLDN